jgi:phosphatidylglycerophosphatase A
LRRVARFLATGAYTGYAPVAPGTAGTLPGLLLVPLFARVALASVPLYLATLFAAIAVAVWAAAEVAREEGVSDPQIVVIDEIVGVLVAMAFIPVSAFTLAAGFLAFRLFDIVKPPPGRRLERLPGGYGIVADDLWAGLLAQAVLRVLLVADVM